jgi:hypothetical protein
MERALISPSDPNHQTESNILTEREAEFTVFRYSAAAETEIQARTRALRQLRSHEISIKRHAKKKSIQAAAFTCIQLTSAKGNQQRPGVAFFGSRRARKVGSPLQSLLISGVFHRIFSGSFACQNRGETTPQG